MNDLEKYFTENNGNLIHKYKHYFDIYVDISQASGELMFTYWKSEYLTAVHCRCGKATLVPELKYTVWISIQIANN
jgi:hypothetical protein